MGGYGSTRWNSHYKKTAVEDCFTLPLAKIKRFLHVGWAGSYKWSRGNEPVGSISYKVEGDLDMQISICLIYNITNQDNEKKDYRYSVSLETTQLPWGGFRYWYICPNIRCGRRVSVLYLPPGGEYFACRHCYRLSYRSRQEGYKDRAAFGHIANLMANTYPQATWRYWKEVFDRH